MRRLFPLIVIIVLYSVTLSGQEFDIIYNTTETNVYTNITYTARNSVTLGPGYSYSPVSGTLTIGIQNPVVLGDESYTSTPVDPETRILSTSYKPGTTQGDLNITPIGGSAYSIPIDVLPGINGLTPNLSLIYSSNSGPGIAGYGWNIDGISMIERGSMIYYFDSPSTSDTTDRFYLDGQRLVNTSYQYGHPSAQYQTDNDIFTRVTPMSTDENGPNWFYAETKSGLLYEYGNTSGSKEKASGSSMVLKWYVSKIKDRHNNEINFAYLQDESVPYLAEITYGTNTITFNYKVRIDKTLSFEKGTKIEHRLILDKITVKYGSNVVKTYELKYNSIYSWNNIYSQLNEFIEYGSGSDRYNSTVFTYWKPTNSSISLTTSNTTHADITYKSKLVPGDFTGDGKADLLCLPDASKGATWTGKKLYKSNGDDTFTYLFTDPNNINLSSLQDILALDINGDGLDHILYEITSGGNSEFRYIINNNGSSFSSSALITTNTTNSSAGFSGKVRRNEFQENDNESSGTDYNGDGVNDILINNSSGTIYIYSFVNQSGVMTSTLNLLTSHPDIFSNEILTSDFNGDGKADIWELDGSELNIRGLNYGNNIILYYYSYSIPITTGHFFSLGDFNADGKTDALIYGSGKGGTENDYLDWKILLSHGWGFTTYLLPQKRANLKDENVRLGDFNDDGRTDIMVTSGNQSWTGTYYYLAKIAGDDFNTYTLSTEPTTSNNFNFGDYNGDGHSDYITTDKVSPWVNGYKVFRTMADTAFALKKVANGLGQLTKINYTKLSQASSTVYQKGTGATYPVRDFQGPLTVVSTVNYDNGLGSLNTQAYYYEGAKSHLQGKGLLCFTRIKMTDATLGLENQNISSYDPIYYYPKLIKAFTKRIGVNDTLNTVTNVWAHRELDATRKRIFPYVQSTTQVNKLTGHKTTVTTAYNDNYGNPSPITKSYNNGSTVTSTETTTHTYNNDVSLWLLGRPTTSLIQYSGYDTAFHRAINRSFESSNNHILIETFYPGTGLLIMHKYRYNDNGTLKRDSISTGSIWRSNGYFYESNGIRLSKIIDPLLHTKEFTYNSSGRLETEKDYLNNTVTYQYDNLGRQTSRSTTFGDVLTTTYAWENVSGSPRYSVQTTGNDGSESKKYYDKLGREVKSDVKGFNGSMISTTTEYNNEGQLYRVSEPGSTSLWNTYSFNNYGQIDGITRPSGRNTTWSYAGPAVTETTAGNGNTKTYSAEGFLISATDNGGTITYSYLPNGKVKTITAPGNIITRMKYDYADNQTKLIDPSAGTVEYTSYDAFGQITGQKNARNQVTTISYTNDGRVDNKVTPEGTVLYKYDARKRLRRIKYQTPSVNKIYRYDTKGRLASVRDSIGNLIDSTVFTYNSLGQLSTILHPSGVTETRYYIYGYFQKVDAGGSTRYTVTSMNARQQLTGVKYGSNLTETRGYNYEYLTSVSTGTSGSVRNYQYDFNSSTGNLNWRKNVKQSNIMENFEYDNLDRLDRVYRGTTTLLDMAYTTNKGGISTKTDVGTLNYNSSSKPYTLTSINPSTGLITSAMNNTLTYTSFESVNTISEGVYSAAFTYNPENQRAKMVIQQNSSTILTRWYMGDSYTKEDAAGVVKEFTYIGGNAYTAPVLGVTQSGSTTYYYLLRDHLGSITHIVNTSNSIVAEYSYDVWGRMRDKTTWVAYNPGSEPSLFSGRGFTGHEHLPWFKMINMNGRLYDPLTGQFLSPDPYIQDPSLTQSLNRLIYCLNNPLKYTDPSGFTLDELMYQTYWGSYNYWVESNAGKIQSGGYRSSHITSTFSGGGGTFTRNSNGSTTITWSEFSYATSTIFGNMNGLLEILAEKGDPITIGHQFTLNPAGLGVHDVSQAGLNFIAGYEGFSATTYKDVAGLPTIGYGHLIKSGESFSTLSRDAARQLLRNDAAFAVNTVNKYVKVSLNQNQFDALTSFTFNIGAGGFSKSSVLRNVNFGNTLSIDKSFMMWNKATINGVLTPIQGLTNRRQAEANLFLNGDYEK